MERRRRGASGPIRRPRTGSPKRSGGAVDAQFSELAVKGRAADAQPPGHFGHAPAIMADGQANDVRLDLRHLTDMAVAFEQGDAGGLPMRLRHGMEPATGPAMAAAADLRGDLREVVGGQRIALAQHSGRSEEHTSELQSLMRISYAV